MPKLKPDTQRARREHILDAAELCFARSGFHRCTMHDICREATISPGALYVHFVSKEALIAGIAERDRAEFQARFAEVANAADFLEALNRLGGQYFVDEPSHKRVMCLEIALEATRNEQVSNIFFSVDEFIQSNFEELFERLRSEGRIASDVEPAMLAKVLSVLGDGLIWRRAVDTRFDSAAIMPVVLKMFSNLLNPTPAPAAYKPSSMPSEADA